jgi:hypothetical protein
MVTMVHLWRRLSVMSSGVETSLARSATARDSSTALGMTRGPACKHRADERHDAARETSPYRVGPDQPTRSALHSDILKTFIGSIAVFGGRSGDDPSTMPVSHAETRNLVFPKSVLLGRSLFTDKRKEHMSRTIKAIERSEPDWHQAAAHQPTQHLRNGRREVVVEWQPRGPETFSGKLNRKLRLVFAPLHSAISAGAAA